MNKELNINDFVAMNGGYMLGRGLYLLNSDDNTNLYKVSVGTGTAWLVTFIVNAGFGQEAVDLVADFCENNELPYISDYYTLLDLCEDETVEEYAEANGLICCGNSGVYMDLQGLEEI